MSRLPAWTNRLLDPLIAVGLVGGYVALLLATVGDLGYARDEGFYYWAAQSYERWFDLLLTDPSAALEREQVDRVWSVNHEHPALMKSLFALSLRYLHTKWHWLSEAGTALRLPGMVVSSLAVGVTYLWACRAVGRWPALVAALLLALMPRVFYHSHLACFDMPVAALWLATTYAYWRSLPERGLRWPILTGVLFGLLLNTKHNSWLLPLALVAHWVLIRSRLLGQRVGPGWVKLPIALVAMLTIGPVLWLLTWPWIWFDTAKRLGEYVSFHMNHDYYNMEFLGQTYWKPPMPRGYAWVMTAATVPSITLLLFAVGLIDSVRLDRQGLRTLAATVAGWSRAWRTRLAGGRQSDTSSDHSLPPEQPAPADAESRRSAPAGVQLRRHGDWLWLVCLLTSYAPWLSTSTPIFGGTKHWLTAYPFLCLLAARGFSLTSTRLCALLGPRLPERLARYPLVAAGLAVCVTLGPALMTAQSHPWGLSAYTPLVGGAPGAATLGLNRTFWGYTTGAVAGFINQRAPPYGAVYVHDTAMQSFSLMHRDGRLRRDLRGVWYIHTSDLALYHHEPHMSRVEYQVWVDYGTTTPAHVGTYHGVPVVWVYVRPR
jgi:4-amino-4-deoxy-L-arabinose transferase-like glycosyltransferase